MNVVELSDDKFHHTIKDSKVPVFVDFWAPWCSPCRMLNPIIEELADGIKDEAIIAKVNVDEEQSLARELSVMSVPTMMIFKEGKIVDSLLGWRPKEEIEKTLRKYC